MPDTRLGGQFIDHLRLDQGGIHVEHHQPTVATVDGVFLEGDVHVQIRGNVKEIRPQCLQILGRPPHGEFHTGDPVAALQAGAPGQARDVVDVEAMPGSDTGNPGDLVRGDVPGHQGDHVTATPLALDPLPVGFLRNGLEAHLQIQLMEAEQQLLVDLGRIVLLRYFREDTPGQVVVDHGLTDVQYAHVEARHDARDLRGQPGLVTPGDIDQYQFTHPLKTPPRRCRVRSLQCGRPAAAHGGACGPAGRARRGNGRGH